AHRHVRIAGQFVRLALRDGKPQYLPHAPRVWAMLERALAHPACAPLAQVLARWIPPECRRNPPGLAAT
ncbi:MAG: aminoglycoside phosphotransferase, partial [Dyella sp.]|nr:aminoglycoside phosphotransferase [Dyella sp.]